MLPKSRRAGSSGINLSAQIILKELWTKENYAVNFTCAASYLTCRKTTGRVQSTQKTCDGILGYKRQMFEGKWRKKKDAEKLPVCARLCPQLSIPPLSAGVKSRKLLLYYSESCGPPQPHPPPSAPWVCVWMTSSFISFFSFCPYVHSRNCCKSI